MGESVLVVASWGDPTGWSPVDYVLGEIRRKSRTSLGVIAERHPGAKMLVVVQETLLAPRNAGGLRERLREAGVDAEPPLLSHASDPSDYHSLLGELQGAMTRLAQAWLGVDAEAVVAPGVGDYPFQDWEDGKWRGVWRLAQGAGTPFDYYASTVLLHVIRRLPGSPTPLRLVVDLTHGVNYTATALYRAALTAARLYAAATHSPVTLEVYNSEPWTPGVDELRVWKIREERIHPRAAASRLVYTMLANRLGGGETIAPLDKTILAGEGHGEAKERAAKKLAENTTNIMRLKGAAEMSAASVIGGFPLLLLQAGLEASLKKAGWSLIANAATSLINALPEVTLDRQGSKIIVTHSLGLSLHATKSLHAGLALASYAARALEKTSTGTHREDCGGHPRITATIDALKRTLDSFVSTPLLEITRRELSRLREHEEKQACSAEDLYTRVALTAKCRRDHPADPNRAAETDERTFSAHAGLNSNLIDALHRDGRVALAYNCRALQNLPKIARSILLKLKNTVLHEQG